MTHHESPENKLNVLVVDDSHFNQTLIGAILEGIGYTCSYADNGAEALEKLNSEIEFNTIFMDCLMPVMDGITAIREIRKSSKYGNVKIVCMSAKIQCHQCSVDAFLDRPVSIESLENLMAKLKN